jgi:hypothetical protein
MFSKSEKNIYDKFSYSEFIGNDETLEILKGKEIDLTSFISECNRRIITPNEAFILSYILIKKINQKDKRTEMKKKIKKLYLDWVSKSSCRDKIEWINMLNFSTNKTICDNLLELTIFNFCETYHFYFLTNDLRGLDYNKINFVKGIYVIHSPFLNFVNTKFDISCKEISEMNEMKVGCCHSQLYIISKNFKFFCDFDEQTETEFLARTSGKFCEYVNLDVVKLQSITDDTYCLFHIMRFVVEVAKENILHFDKNELKKINKILSFNGRITIAKMRKWIYELVKTVHCLQ